MIIQRRTKRSRFGTKGSKMIRELLIASIVFYIAVTSGVGTLTLILTFIEFVRDKDRD